MAAGEPGTYHNRLTHSLAVARIGRAVADALLTQPNSAVLTKAADVLDPTVVEAACLAHDLGHPPFAHVGEAELDRLLIAAGVADGFEANAQSFRVVCTLPNGESGEPGLNLTRATLAAILKYPWLRDGSSGHPRKWGAYASEADDLAWARAHLPHSDCHPTLEAQVMDWADLVAYAALDFEDFVRAGSLPLAQLRADAAERARFLEMVVTRRCVSENEQTLYEMNLVQLLCECPASEPLPASRAGRKALRCFINHDIDRAIGGVTVATEAGNHLTLEIDPTVKARILLLEALTWHYVIDSELLVPQRDAQRAIIRSLFEALEQRFERVPTKSERLRMVSDCIASMTEAEAIALARNLGIVNETW